MEQDAVIMKISLALMTFRIGIRITAFKEHQGFFVNVEFFGVVSTAKLQRCSLFN